jgi:hypothetical protein
MTLKQYRQDGTQVFFKVINGRPHPSFVEATSKNKSFNIGIAFRTHDAPIGYFPFYGANDFNFSGDTSFKEEVLARLPISLSSVASPHSLLIKETAGDVEFLGSGDEKLEDIQQLVKNDLLRHAMVSASGVFIDGIMVALGGPAIKSVVNQLIKSKVKQFVLSRAISGAAKKYLKENSGFDANKFLSDIP